MRKFVFAVCLLAVFLLAQGGNAAYWHIECSNYSCRATAGMLMIFWSGDEKNGGKLTGVVLPISVEDVASMEEAASATLERVLSGGMGVKVQSDKDIKMDQEMRYSKRFSLSGQRKRSKSVRVDATLRFFEYYANNHPVCEIQKTQLIRWMCAAESILDKYKSGDIQDIIYAYFLHEGLKDIPTPELEKLVVKSDAEESGDVALYLIAYRFPFLFSTSLYDPKEAVLALKAFYTYPRDPVRAYALNKVGAFVGYLMKKRLIEKPAEESILNVIYGSEPIEKREKYWGEFEKEVKTKRLIGYGVKGGGALLTFVAVGIAVLRKRETLIQTLKDVKARVLARLRKEVP